MRAPLCILRMRIAQRRIAAYSYDARIGTTTYRPPAAPFDNAQSRREYKARKIGTTLHRASNKNGLRGKPHVPIRLARWPMQHLGQMASLSYPVVLKAVCRLAQR